MRKLMEGEIYWVRFGRSPDHWQIGQYCEKLKRTGTPGWKVIGMKMGVQAHPDDVTYHIRGARNA